MSAHTIRVGRGVTAGEVRRRRGGADRLLIFGAPVAAALAGVSAEWLDFRALRYPLLLLVLTGVLATAHTIESRGRGQESGRGRRRPYSALVRTLIIGVLTWAAAETLYVMVHAARGEAFEAERFGPQWVQALGLIGVHGLVLGAPTGIAAGVLLQVRSLFRRGATS